MPPSVLDMVVGTPPSPFKLLGLTHADCFSLGTSVLPQETQSAMVVERLSARMKPAGHNLHCCNDGSSAYRPGSQPRLVVRKRDVSESRGKTH